MKESSRGNQQKYANSHLFYYHITGYDGKKG